MNSRQQGFPESPSLLSPLERRFRKVAPDFSANKAVTERLILFTRYPVAGQTKTRLVPCLGAEGAAALQRRLTLRTLRAAETLSACRNVDFEIHFTGTTQSTMEQWLGDRFRFRSQSQGHLGARMASAIESSFRDGIQATVLIGADCPELSPDILDEAFTRLLTSPVVFGPAKDGGYYLVGMRQPIPQLFSGPLWGTNTVLDDSLEILRRAGIDASLLTPLSDIDRPEDMAVWQQIESKDSEDLSRVSIIIPALNESDQIEAVVASAGQAKHCEIIVVDGGSQDDTPERARKAGAIVLKNGAGRAHQMNAGASKASGNILLFLHADTLLSPDYQVGVARALMNKANAAGAFQFAVAKSFSGSKLVQWSTNFRSRWRQMPYGDQGLFLRRSLFEELGGFADLPILEDYELVCRLRRRGRIVTVHQAAITSARRWRQLGFLRTTLINQWVILAYRCGWPIERLAAIYRKRRHHRNR